MKLLCQCSPAMSVNVHESTTLSHKTNCRITYLLMSMATYQSALQASKLDSPGIRGPVTDGTSCNCGVIPYR